MQWATGVMIELRLSYKSPPPPPKETSTGQNKTFRTFTFWNESNGLVILSDTSPFQDLLYTISEGLVKVTFPSPLPKINGSHYKT